MSMIPGKVERAEGRARLRDFLDRVRPPPPTRAPTQEPSWGHSSFLTSLTETRFSIACVLLPNKRVLYYKITETLFQTHHVLI